MNEYEMLERRSDYINEEHTVIDADDIPHTFWHCEKCGSQNSCYDGECQYCDADIQVPCIDNTENHAWVVSDEDENLCYCEYCGCLEY